MKGILVGDWGRQVAYFFYKAFESIQNLDIVFGVDAGIIYVFCTNKLAWITMSIWIFFSKGMHMHKKIWIYDVAAVAAAMNVLHMYYTWPI